MPARVLIIEDHPANLELMSYLLRAFGHTVLAAPAGEEGLKLARRDRPDLIVCDIQLPGIDGHGVARRLRSDSGWRQVPLLAVTALAMVGDREKILAAGFDGYVAKPIEPQSFVSEVERFLPRELRSIQPPITSTVISDLMIPQAGGQTILVVDNLETNLQLARSLLESSGYSVQTASTIVDALWLARAGPPQLILSDVCMGEASGYDFIQVVKGEPTLAAIPFVFITSTMTSEAERKRGLGLGAVRYLFRPIDSEVLLREIEACLIRKERCGNGNDIGGG